MKLDLVGQNWIDLVWPEVQVRIDDLCKNYMAGKYEAGDLLAACHSGEMQMWLAVDEDGPTICGVCLTEVVQYPQGRWGRVVGLTGRRMQEWLPFLHNIEAWFRAEGCKGVVAGGRHEWRRILARHGYADEALTLFKRFGHAS